MTHFPAIWTCIIRCLPKRRWVALADIYSLIERNVCLDKEDFEKQSPDSESPKWKRNVRNVLQCKKKNDEIAWD